MLIHLSLSHFSVRISLGYSGEIILTHFPPSSIKTKKKNMQEYLFYLNISVDIV